MVKSGWIKIESSMAIKDKVIIRQSRSHKLKFKEEFRNSKSLY